MISDGDGPTAKTQDGSAKRDPKTVEADGDGDVYKRKHKDKKNKHKYKKKRYGVVWSCMVTIRVVAFRTGFTSLFCACIRRHLSEDSTGDAGADEKDDETGDESEAVARGPDKSFVKSPARYSSSPTGGHVPQTKRPGVPQRAASVAAEAVCVWIAQTITHWAKLAMHRLTTWTQAAAAIHAKADPVKRRKEDRKDDRGKRSEPAKDARAVYFPDNEEFFHCRTGSVVRKDDARLVDSDDEIDIEWIRKQNEEVRKSQHAI